jgi:hypothetical protein
MKKRLAIILIILALAIGFGIGFFVGKARNTGSDSADDTEQTDTITAPGGRPGVTQQSQPRPINPILMVGNSATSGRG